jgi:DNA-binding NarL/FixJ family response regulator
MPEQNGAPPAAEQDPNQQRIFLVTISGEFDESHTAKDEVASAELAQRLAPLATGDVEMGVSVHSVPGHINPKVIAEMLGDWLEKYNHAQGCLASLSPKEAEVAMCITRSLSNAQIAGEVFLSEQTVKGYVSTVLQKLGVASRAGVAAILGVLPMPDRDKP